MAGAPDPAHAVAMTRAALALVALAGCTVNLSPDPAPAPVPACEPAALEAAPRTAAWLAVAVEHATLVAELCGAVVIAVAVVRAMVTYVAHALRRDEAAQSDAIRLQLGKALALGLEFELAADILKTAVAPTLPVIGQLAAIIVLRTMLNYFLERELRRVEERTGAGSTAHLR